MNIIQSFILGIIEGLTEFIPVSSTAHMLIAQKLLNIAPSDTMFAFLVLVQIGPLIALIVYFWKDLLAIITDALKNLGGLSKFNSLPLNAKLGWYIIIATIPALLAGVLLKHFVEVSLALERTDVVFFCTFERKTFTFSVKNLNLCWIKSFE